MYLTTRYMSKGLFSVCILVTLVLTSIIWLTQSLRLLELIVNSSAPISLFLKMIVLSLPRFMEVIFPIAVMASVVFVYNRMIADNELIIMRSAGINPLALARPALMLSGVVTAILLLMTTWLSPVSLTKVQNLRQVVKAEYSAFLLREGVFNPISKDLTVYLRERGPKGELRGLLIHDTRPENETPITITAQNGVMVTAENEPKVIVYNGIRQQFDTKTQSLSKLEFDEYTLEIKDFQSQVRKRWRYSKERTLTELLSPDMNNKRDRQHASAFRSEALKRMIMPFSAIGYALVTLACLLTGSFNRRGQSKRILTAVAIALVLQSGYMGLSNLLKTHFWAVPVLYIAILAPIFISLFMISDKGRLLLYTITQGKRKIESKQT